MIIATLVVYLQMKYLNSKDMGFRKERLLVVDINSGKVRHSAETIKTEIGKLSPVKDVSVSSRVPGEWKDLPKVNIKNENIQSPAGDEMFFLGIDDHFLSTYQIHLLSGRNFAGGSPADSSAVILNETAARELGIKEVSAQQIDILLNKPFRAKVIGIVRDFNFQSLREPLAPMVLGFQNNPVQNIDYFTVRLSSSGSMTETLGEIDAILHRIDMGHLFEYHFLDKQWDLFYREDRMREIIFLMVAFLTIIIASLGLFGLATFAGEQRVKEIGIRKVLGASIGNIIQLLSADFLKLVSLAALIAFPVAWLAMNQWLEGFAYRIRLNWWVFIAAGLAALLIAMFTISFRAIKAARSNPVRSLRAE
jgi:putative ABC transport system permease protein